MLESILIIKVYKTRQWLVNVYIDLVLGLSPLDFTILADFGLDGNTLVRLFFYESNGELKQE